MRTRPFNAVAAAAIVALALAAGDAARSAHAGTGAPAVAYAPRPGTVTTPVPWGPAQIVIYKSKRTLALYRNGDFEKEFRVSLGLQPMGRKRHADDARTPEGLYRVVGKRRHPRWQHFLAIDYPNATDRRRYEEAVRDGRIPDDGGSPFAIGDAVGIHGNDRPGDQEKGLDWTKGCVAMKAADIAELAARVPVGTPVWIVE